MGNGTTIDGGTKSVGGGLNDQMQNFAKQRNNSKQVKFASLRVGEIVFGRISGIIQNEIAYVKLPIGTFSAIIHKGIRQGDELYFRVEEVSTDLILKVHSVSIVNNNKKLNINEITRILDLPQEDIFYDIIEIMQKDNSQIVKNDVLLVLTSVHKLIKDFDKNTNIVDLIKICIFLNKIKIDSDLGIVRSLYPFVLGEKKIALLLNQFVDLSNKLPNNTKNKLNSIFDFIDKKYVYLDKSLRLFSNKKNIESLNNICQKIISISSNNNIFLQLQKISKQILNILESQAFWNHLAFESGNKLHIFHAFKIDNQLIVSNISLLLTSGKRYTNTNKIQAKNLQEFDIYDLLIEKLNNIVIFSDSFFTSEEYANEIKSLFATLGIEIISFYLYDEFEMECDLILPENQTIKKKFSVVV